MMSPFKTLRILLAASLVLCAVGAAPAAPVSFSIDMASQPTASQVYLRGSFNNWGNPDVTVNGLLLTNDPAGPTPTIYSGTVDIASSPGTVESCKFFYQPGDNWEGDPNRQFVIAGGAQTLPLTAWNEKYPAPPNDVTFQIDMTQQVKLGNFDPNTGYVRVSGGFNGWGESIDFTNNPAATEAATNIYSQTLVINGFPGGQPGEYKFRAPILNAVDTYETIPNRPSFTLTGGDQTLPIVFWNNIAPFTPTNNVTFQVDMSAQILGGGFLPGVHPIRVAGDFPGGAFDGVDLTNNPALSGNASNIYSQVVTIIADTNTFYKYKFRANGGYENPAPANQYPPFGDRGFTIAGGNQVLPLVFYSDASPCDLLTQDTTVTFVLRLTNGTIATDGTVYDGSQTVHINGEFNGWAPWDLFLPTLNNNPIGSDFYEYTTLIPKGRPLAQKYKFSVGGADNEAPGGQDHIQYVRTTSASFTLPVAEFGTNYASVRVEQAFGNLQVGAPVGGNVPITWLGLPCVTLQTRDNLTSGTWTDLPATDATSSTNWPLSTSSEFFRLQKRASP